MFILTNTSSLKILQQKTNIKLNEHSNIYIDRDNSFHIPTKNAIYPCVIKLKNGKASISIVCFQRLTPYGQKKHYFIRFTAPQTLTSDEIDMQSSIPDARNTLLWAPSVTTDEKGEATVSFYCSDINTVYIGQIEGIDGSGRIGATTCEFRVMKY